MILVASKWSLEKKPFSKYFFSKYALKGAYFLVNFEDKGLELYCKWTPTPFLGMGFSTESKLVFEILELLEV